MGWGSIFIPCFFIDLEGKVVGAASSADVLRKTLDAETSEHSALQAFVASVCNGLGVEVGQPRSSLHGWVEALYT
jgi:hypothetical protein